VLVELEGDEDHLIVKDWELLASQGVVQNGKALHTNNVFVGQVYGVSMPGMICSFLFVYSSM
jgi:hypothetical protein